MPLVELPFAPPRPQKSDTVSSVFFRVSLSCLSSAPSGWAIHSSSLGKNLLAGLVPQGRSQAESNSATIGEHKSLPRPCPFTRNACGNLSPICKTDRKAILEVLPVPADSLELQTFHLHFRTNGDREGNSNGKT